MPQKSGYRGKNTELTTVGEQRRKNSLEVACDSVFRSKVVSEYPRKMLHFAYITINIQGERVQNIIRYNRSSELSQLTQNCHSDIH
jgi:hypothetical protein